MVYRGKVQRGVVVLLEGASLPDGTEVTVTPCEAPAVDARSGERAKIWEKMEQLARWAESQPCDLPEDLAANHDHYLHGLPKRT